MGISSHMRMVSGVCPVFCLDDIGIGIGPCPISGELSAGQVQLHY